MNQHIRDYVILDRLAGLGEIDFRPMFEGFGLYREGRFFGVVAAGQLYLKTWPATVGRYQARGMEPFTPSPTTRLKSYLQVPAEVLDDPPQLCAWAEEALQGSGSDA